jgi:hypothetical protein
MGTKTKYLSLKIVVDGENEALCGQQACPRFAALDLNATGKRVCSCGAFQAQLNWPPPVKRCDGCLGAKEI